MKNKVGLFFLICISAIIIGYFVRIPVLKGRFLVSLAPYFRLIYPKPNDYWIPISNTSVINSNSVNLNATHKYIGKHSVDLVFLQGNTSKSFQIRTPLVGSISFYKEDELIYKDQVSNSLPYWSLDSDGMILVHYQVPENIPIDTDIKIIVNFESGLEELKEQFGDVSILVSKVSDM